MLYLEVSYRISSDLPFSSPDGSCFREPLRRALQAGFGAYSYPSFLLLLARPGFFTFLWALPDAGAGEQQRVAVKGGESFGHRACSNGALLAGLCGFLSGCA